MSALSETAHDLADNLYNAISERVSAEVAEMVRTMDLLRVTALGDDQGNMPEAIGRAVKLLASSPA